MKNKRLLIKSPNIKNQNFKYHFMMSNIIFGWSFTKFDVSLCIAFLFKCDPICHLVINLVKWISYPSQSRVSFPSRERRTKKFDLFFTLTLWQAVIFTIRSRPKVLTVIWIIIPHLQVALKWIEIPSGPSGHDYPDVIKE